MSQLQMFLLRQNWMIYERKKRTKNVKLKIRGEEQEIKEMKNCGNR